MSIFATKSIEQLKAEAAATGEHSLKRVLGPINLVTLGIGAIIGTGIFVLTGQAAAQYAGPGIVLSMVLAGFASALAGLCYSEFASTVPIAGSAYTYGYATLGEFIAWIIGWDLILEYALGAATVAVGWSGHLVSFLHDFAGIEIPGRRLRRPPCTLVNAAGCNPDAVFNLPAVLITLAVTVLIVIGIKESANVNAAIVIVKVAVVRDCHPGRRGVCQHRELDAVHPREHRQRSASTAGAASCAAQASSSSRISDSTRCRWRRRKPRTRRRTCRSAFSDPWSSARSSTSSCPA